MPAFFPSKEITIRISASDPEKAKKHLQILADKIEESNLKILADKATKKGINDKIRKYQFAL